MAQSEVFMRAVRVIVGVITAVSICALGPVPGERLFSERRDAHALASCGKKKACLRRPALSTHDSGEHVGTPRSAVQFRTRWAREQYDDVSVWIAAPEDIADGRTIDRFMVRDAFHAWSNAGAPVRFVFVSDSSRADVQVFWRDSLPDSRAGQVTRLVDGSGWLRAAAIEISTRNMAGGAQDSVTVRSVAMHEVGHLLGLEHSSNKRDIMASWVTARALTPRDRSAMRALYDVAVAR